MSFSIPGATDLPLGEEIHLLLQVAKDLRLARVRRLPFPYLTHLKPILLIRVLYRQYFDGALLFAIAIHVPLILVGIVVAAVTAMFYDIIITLEQCVHYYVFFFAMLF